MSDDVLHSLNEIEYYVDEYQKSNPEVGEDVMVTIAKEIKEFVNKNKLYYLYFRSLIIIIKAKAILCSSYVSEDERFNNIINKYLEDLSLYYEYAQYLKKHLDKCVKSKDYESLDDSYVLGVNLLQFLAYLKLYIRDIEKVAKEYSSSSYTVIYPDINYTSLNEKRNEIKAIIKKLKKDPE